MGIASLLQHLKFATQKLNALDFCDQVLAVDASSWLYKGGYACAEGLTEPNGDEKTKAIYTKYILSRCSELLTFAKVSSIILVFDGKRCPLKTDTNAERQRKRSVNIEEARRLRALGRKGEAAEKFQKCVYVSAKMARFTAEAVFKVYGNDENSQVKCIFAPYEADSQLAKLCLDGLAHAVISEDSDILVYSAALNKSFPVIFKLNKDNGSCDVVSLDWLLSALPPTATSTSTSSTKKDYVPPPNLLTGAPGPVPGALRLFSNREKKAGTGRRLFIQSCILSGCDYVPSLPKVGIVAAFKLVGANVNISGEDRVGFILRQVKGEKAAKILAVEEKGSKGGSKEKKDDECNIEDNTDTDFFRAVVKDYKAYEELCYKAEAVFFYHRVYDCKLKKVVPLQPLPDEDGTLDYIPNCCKRYGSMEGINAFIGEEMSDKETLALGNNYGRKHEMKKSGESQQQSKAPVEAPVKVKGGMGMFLAPKGKISKLKSPEVKKKEKAISKFHTSPPLKSKPLRSANVKKTSIRDDVANVSTSNSVFSAGFNLEDDDEVQEVKVWLPTPSRLNRKARISHAEEKPAPRSSPRKNLAAFAYSGVSSSSSSASMSTSSSDAYNGALGGNSLADKARKSSQMFEERSRILLEKIASESASVVAEKKVEEKEEVERVGVGNSLKKGKPPSFAFFSNSSNGNKRKDDHDSNNGNDNDGIQEVAPSPSKSTRKSRRLSEGASQTSQTSQTSAANSCLTSPCFSNSSSSVMSPSFYESSPGGNGAMEGRVTSKSKSKFFGEKEGNGEAGAKRSETDQDQNRDRGERVSKTPNSTNTSLSSSSTKIGVLVKRIGNGDDDVIDLSDSPVKKMKVDQANGSGLSLITPSTATSINSKGASAKSSFAFNSTNKFKSNTTPSSSSSSSSAVVKKKSNLFQSFAASSRGSQSSQESDAIPASSSNKTKPSQSSTTTTKASKSSVFTTTKLKLQKKAEVVKKKTSNLFESFKRGKR